MVHKRASTIVRAAMWAFVVSLALMSLCGRASAQAPAGSVTSLTGTAHDERAAKTFDLAQGTQVLVGDKITTGPASVAAITLTDQSRLEVRESTTITLDQHLVGPGGRISTQVGLISGLLRSFVHLTSSGAVPNFEVHTPNAVAAARATQYDTSHETGQSRPDYPSCYEFTDVSVQEGTVELRSTKNPSTPAAQVSAGHKATVPCSLAPVLVASLSEIFGAGAGGLGGLAPAAAIIGGTAVVAGGVVGGVAASGGFGGSSSSPSR